MSGVRLFTCSFTEYRPDMGVGVRISLSAPRWIKRDKPWPTVAAMTPQGWYLREPDDEVFYAHLRRQLEKAGPRAIYDELHTIADAEGDDRLVLLCFEKLSKPGADCHRSFVARWWLETTGEEVPELGALPRCLPEPMPEPTLFDGDGS